MNATCADTRRRRLGRRYALFLRTTLMQGIGAALFAPCAWAAGQAASNPNFVPVGGHVVDRSGAALIRTPTSNTMVIDQSTQSVTITWSDFSIGSNAKVTFNQPSATAVALNRVTTSNPSEIYGQLTANGRVFLVNPSGILFAPGSTVNVGGLIASTLDISPDNFNRGVATGSYAFGTGVSFQGNVENDGTITANPGGTVALLGGRVQNGNGSGEASISAPQGTVALGVGSQITVNIGGDGLTQLQINTSAVNPNGTYAQNYLGGTLAADGGQVLMQALGNPFASVVNNGIVQARSMMSRAGRIVLSSASDDGTSNLVNVQGGTLDASGIAAGVRGGDIELAGYNVGVLSLFCTFCDSFPFPPTPSLIDASGSTGGGTISVTANNVAEVSGLTTLNASATNNGNGGSIIVKGANGLYAFGSISAEGGVNGGNGGLVETSGGGISLGGIEVSAKAPRGAAGQWLIDPYDVTIVHGNAAGTLPATPFDPITDSTIQDGDINNALNSGNNVTIGTGSGGPPDSGDIYIDGTVMDPTTGLLRAVDILRSSGAAPLTFRLDANARIGGDNFQVHSTAGPLGVIFDSDANGTNSDNGNMAFANASIRTNGGDLSMYGQDDPANGFATSQYNGGIQLNTVTLDTRSGGSDANSSGNILLRGSGSCLRSCLDDAVVGLIGSNLYASTGSIQISGLGATGSGINSGVTLDSDGDGGPGTLLSSTSGAITVTGVGAGDGAVGLYLGAASVRSLAGGIDLRGHGDVDGDTVSDGLDIAAGAAIRSSSGLTLLSGSSDGSGTGVNIAAGAVIDAGSGDMVVRAHNDGGADALVLAGTLLTTGVIDLRPGSVSSTGALVENVSDAITVGGATGFGVSAIELGHLSATTLILGSSIQAGAISVLVPISYARNLTLQAGGIAVNGALNVGANTLALISAGNITQGAPLTAASLLVRSSAGAVTLTNAANQVSADTLAGSAAGNFSFVNAAGVGIGNVTASGFDAASNTPAALAGSGVNGGGDVLVRALAGNMTLRANVSGNKVDLVSNGIFDNAGGNAITAGGNWQVWGNTWVGENRGGLAGNGSLPNLYGCTYSAACGVTPSTTANQFIYTAQPLATISFSDSTREYGLPDTAIDYDVSGMILGDRASNAITGSVATTATEASSVGKYPIDGEFVSPAGYRINVLAGVLAVTPATLAYVANPLTRLYGDPNGTLAGTVTGFRLTDTLATATTGTLVFTTSATEASNIGLYAINGSGLGATNYVFSQSPGNATALRINPATLFYSADPKRRMVGTPNGDLGGTVTGFRGGDTQATATTGSLEFQTSAEIGSPAGTYAINGTGLAATNYLFVQDPANALALTVTPPPGTYSLDVVRDMPVTYVYDRNFGIVALCPANDLAAGSRDQDGDTLSREWSRVRSRPNLANCVATRQKDGCGDF
ncbi:MAG: MBG domain-containing protein [Rhodanobacter sp.]